MNKYFYLAFSVLIGLGSVSSVRAQEVTQQSLNAAFESFRKNEGADTDLNLTTAMSNLAEKKKVDTRTILTPEQRRILRNQLKSILESKSMDGERADKISRVLYIARDPEAVGIIGEAYLKHLSIRSAEDYESPLFFKAFKNFPYEETKSFLMSALLQSKPEGVREFTDELALYGDFVMCSSKRVADFQKTINRGKSTLAYVNSRVIEFNKAICYIPCLGSRDDRDKASLDAPLDRSQCEPATTPAATGAAKSAVGQ